ncbi:solute carrier family 22 member 7-like [Rhipicephalus microplus]|uniref:solute carrier family 22 member 7-like n=1 Tax=Rhipicephalus microplus TaxID=6941 RepID=UPI003F6B062E
MSNVSLAPTAGGGVGATTEQSHSGGICLLPDPMTEVQGVITGLHDVLGHGAFQRRVLLFGVMSTLVLLCHAFSYWLIARPVDHWCRPPDGLVEPSAAWNNASVPRLPDGSLSQCAVYNLPFQVPCNGWHYNTTSPQDSIVSEWDLVCDRSWLLPFASAAYMSGALVCVPVSGMAADRWGRKPVINAWVIALLIAGFGCVGASSYSLFVTSRVIVSAATSSITVIALVLLLEVTREERQVLFVLIYATSGPLLLPFIYYLIELYRLNWRMTEMVLMLPTSLLVTCVYLIEESPVWLLAHWRTRAAQQVVLLAALVNGVSAERAADAFRHIRESFDGLELGRDTTFVVSPNAFIRKLRFTALPVELCWFTTFFGFYGINFRGAGTSPVAPTPSGYKLFVALLAPLVAVTYWSMRRMGLRITLCVLLCLTSAACAVWSLINPAPTEMDVAGMVLRVLITLLMYPVYLHTAQVFPAQACCMGFCASYAVGQFGALGGSLLARSNEMTFGTFLGVTSFAAFCGILSITDSRPLADAPKALRPFTPSSDGVSAFQHHGAEEANRAWEAEELEEPCRKTSVVSFATVDIKADPTWPSATPSRRRSVSR